MNDFREYSAAFHAQNDDVLHYGVKGMKWKHHKLPLGGVIGLGKGLVRLGRVKRKESDDEQPDRGRYADSARAAEQAKTVEKNRSDLKNVIETANLLHKDYKIQKKWKKQAFEKTAKQGLADDQFKKEMATHDKAKRASLKDKELDKERKRRQRIAANHRKAEQAYRRGGH